MNRIKIQYIGTDVGKIYLTDINKGESYILHGEVLLLDEKDDISRSLSSGVLKYFSTVESSEFFGTSAPLCITVGNIKTMYEIIYDTRIKASVDINGISFTVMCNKTIDVNLLSEIMIRFRDILNSEDIYGRLQGM
jgi:hypothetical protein